MTGLALLSSASCLASTSIPVSTAGSTWLTIGIVLAGLAVVLAMTVVRWRKNRGWEDVATGRDTTTGLVASTKVGDRGLGEVPIPTGGRRGPRLVFVRSPEDAQAVGEPATSVVLFPDEDSDESGMDPKLVSRRQLEMWFDTTYDQVRVLLAGRSRVLLDGEPRSESFGAVDGSVIGIGGKNGDAVTIHVHRRGRAPAGVDDRETIVATEEDMAALDDLLASGQGAATAAKPAGGGVSKPAPESTSPVAPAGATDTGEGVTVESDIHFEELEEGTTEEAAGAPSIDKGASVDPGITVENPTLMDGPEETTQEGITASDVTVLLPPLDERGRPSDESRRKP